MAEIIGGGTEEFSEFATTGAWSVMYLIGVLLLLIALTGLYARQSQESSVLGVAGFLAVKIPHTFWNSSNEPVVFEAEMQPAQSFENSVRTAFGLARDGKTNDKGVPTNIWELALVYELAGSYVTGIPLFLQRRIFGILAKIACWKGYDPKFSRYTKPHDEEAASPVIGRTGS